MLQLLNCSRLVGTSLPRQLSTLSRRIALPNSSQFNQLQQSCLLRCLHNSQTHRSENTSDRSAPLVVYKGPLTGQMKRLKVFSLFTSAIGLYVAPTVMTEMGKAGMGIAIMMGSVMGIFTLMTPVLIHMVVRNYITKMEYDPATDRYTAETITLMLRTRSLTFGAGDVHVPDVPGMFTTFVVKGKPLFADASQFEPIEHFGRIMGYDQPVDLKLSKPPPPPPAGTPEKR